MAVVVPAVTSSYISPFIEDMVGNTSVLFLSSSIISALLTLLITLGFMALLGGSGILRLFGVIGVLGMVVTYYILGNIWDAVIPLLMLLLAQYISIKLKQHKEAKEARKAREKKKAANNRHR